MTIDDYFAAMERGLRQNSHTVRSSPFPITSTSGRPIDWPLQTNPACTRCSPR